MKRLLPIVALALLAACAPRQRDALSPTLDARNAGPSSSDGETVGRWLLSELIAPGGTADGAKKARERLDKVGHAGMLGSLAVALDDEQHGAIARSAEEHYAAFVAARASRDPMAPLVAWYAANHLVGMGSTALDVWSKHKAEVKGLLDDPQHAGWRARGELVEWWSRGLLRDGVADVQAQGSAAFGCSKDVRIAGPFGREALADKRTSFPPEKPGPWPPTFGTAADASLPETRVPRIRKTERQGCLVHVDEPVAPGIFYGETYVDVATPRDVIIAAQGALALWVDDSLVLERDLRTWGVWPKFGVGVHLAAGRHRILARIDGPETSIRVLREDGAPADVKTSTDANAPYAMAPPGRDPDPNVLTRYVDDGRVRPPKDELEAFLAAYVAAIEGQLDVASVLFEPLVANQEQAAGVALATAATYAEKDPIFPEGDARDLGRILREKAVERDPRLFRPRMFLMLEEADKGLPETTRKVKAMADELPDVVEVSRVLGSLYQRLGWRAERGQLALDVVKRFPDDRQALEQAIEVLEEGGRTGEADTLAAHLVKLYPDSEITLERALARHDYAGAIAELRRLAERRPDRKEVLARVTDLLVRAGDKGDAVEQLERALVKNPRDANARLSLADVRLAKGDPAALRKALATAIQQGAPTDDLRAAIELVEGMTELEPYRLDTKTVIREFENSKVQMEGTAARVLDYSALWIHPDGSARMLEHELIRVQSQEAIGKLAEQQPPQGALILRMRVIKKSGATLEPERAEGKPTLTMPHLEVGDYIETETITSTAGDFEGGKRYLGPQWFFREADVAYFRSEFLVISPKEKPLVVETRGPVPPPDMHEESRLVLRRWRVDRSEAAPAEPASAPIQEFLPSVRVGWGLTLESQLERMRDLASDETARDPRIARVAARIVEGVPAERVRERARRIYRWVVANVEDGREGDGRRVVIGRSGSRAAAFLTLARAVNLPIDIAVVRDALTEPSPGELSTALEFNDVVLRLAPDRPAVAPSLASDRAPLHFVVGEKYAPFGYLPAELRGQPAIRLVDGFPRETTTTGGAFDGIAYDGAVDLRADGSAQVQLKQRFSGQLGIGVRGNLESMPEQQLRGVVESKILSRAFPGARLATLAIEDADDLDKPLTLNMGVEVSDFARRRGNALAFKVPLVMQVGGLAPLETRKTPMLLPEATHTEVKLAIKLPKGASIDVPPHPETIKDGDRSFVENDRIENGTLILDRTIDIPAGRITVDDYAKFRDFVLRVDELDGREILLRMP